MISIDDLEWVAGFLEAEGCFHFSKANHLNISAAQVEAEPVVRLKNIYGGSLRLINAKKINHSNIYHWRISHSKAAGLMMILFPLLSPKRQEEIKLSLSQWKTRKPAGQHRTHCFRGHELSGENLYVHHGKRYCKECRSYESQVERGWRTPEWKLRNPGEKMNHHCKYGHAYEGDNIYIWNGKRYCRACRTHAEAVKRGWKKKPEKVNVL